MRLKSNRLKVSGFTLVELLVFIGIIALLMAILLPALGRARSAANSVKCESNLHQIMLASQMYTQEHHGFFPPAHYLDATETPPHSVTGAECLLARYATNFAQIVQCPENPTAINLKTTYSILWPVALDMPQYSSYQCNFAIYVDDLGASTPPSPMNITQLQHFSSDQLALYDGSVCSGQGGPWEIAQARHPGPSFNAAFVDGHVEKILCKLYIDPNGPSASPPTRTPSGSDTLPNYTVDRKNRPIYYAGAESIPRINGQSQGMTIPGWGPICWGLVEWRLYQNQ